jgi:hypothetical protein
MQKDLNQTVKEILLFVHREPTDVTRNFVEKDADGNAVRDVNFNEQTLRGIWMTTAFGTSVIDMEIQVRPEQVKSMFPDAPKFSDIFRTYLRAEDAFASGKKLILARVSNQPRVQKTGDKAGVTTVLVPVLVGYEIVEAKDEDIKFIEALLATQNKTSVPDTTSEAASVA